VVPTTGLPRAGRRPVARGPPAVRAAGPSPGGGRREAIEGEFGLERDDDRSEHLGAFGYYAIRGEDGEGRRRSYRLREQLAGTEAVAEAQFELVPMAPPLALVPNDTHFGDQWDMTRIDAPDGWDLDTGRSGVTIGVIDSGCDLGDPNDPGDTGHPDPNVDGRGYDAATGADDGRPNVGSRGAPHGTCVAGIAAAMPDSGRVVAGVSGACEVHAVALRYFTNAEMGRAINEAANAAGVDVINMSLGWRARRCTSA
jgi:subtilisin family serine protease